MDVLQRELLEAREALARQQDEHEGAQSAAAERIAAALGGAQEMQVQGAVVLLLLPLRVVVVVMVVCRSKVGSLPNKHIRLTASTLSSLLFSTHTLHAHNPHAHLRYTCCGFGESSG